MSARWYLSAKAIREYLAIVRRPDDDGGPEWGRAERELAEIAERAHRVGTTGSGLERWAGPRPLRLQLIVSSSARPEGDLPQLVGVRSRGQRHRPPR